VSGKKRVAIKGRDWQLADFYAALPRFMAAWTNISVASASQIDITGRHGK
jgi:hypothetical protein